MRWMAGSPALLSSLLQSSPLSSHCVADSEALVTPDFRPLLLHPVPLQPEGKNQQEVPVRPGSVPLRRSECQNVSSSLSLGFFFLFVRSPSRV